MPGKLKATDSQIRRAYRKTKSIYKTAAMLKICHQSVHERLEKLGIQRNGNGSPWTKREDDILRNEYSTSRQNGMVKALASKLGRAYTATAMRAHQLGISSVSYLKSYSRKIKSEAQARAVFDEFKNSGELLWQFCKRKGLSDDLMAKEVAARWPDEWELVIESKAPSQTMYRLGRQFEYRVRDIFKAAGYFVLRSPGSKTPVDLVAIKIGRVVFIQCKRSGTIVSREWNELYRLAKSCGAVPLLANMKHMQGTELWEMTGEKDGVKRRQPRIAFTP